MLLANTKRKYKSLAIIGNGFDLAHGYKTTFDEFVKNTSNANLDIFREFCVDEHITTWHRFEENIKLISINIYQNNFVDNANFNEISNKIAQLNRIFADIHNLLIEFLKIETNRFQTRKMYNIKRCINSKTKVVNFNYTKVAEEYTTDIFYAHGYIEENNIVLGYDYSDEPCLISMEYMYWFKKYRRELLAFKRYLETEKFLETENLKYKQLMESFEKYQMYANSGRGIDEEVENEIEEFNQINDFICNECEKRLIPDIDYSKIKTITVIGHGIESDKEFLKEILQKCIKLNRVIVFRYNGESDESFISKSEFFKPYCKKIYTKYYCD